MSTGDGISREVCKLSSIVKTILNFVAIVVIVVYHIHNKVFPVANVFRYAADPRKRCESM